ncbi:MAG: colanic acid/amylovoran biosynthesis glycosyltransferase [Solirubrobacterales bacterium]|jgi:glycosyltransferase involved in cell wall biosynthesis|nr:colanic acid/amylovoran biosynthesis glycosyltransferase [Solirubrobacterales bacterium]
MMTDEPAAEAGRRPPVSVVVPFAGGATEAVAALGRLARLRLGDADEVVIADNSGGQAGDWGELPERFQVVEASDQRSAYYARNVGAERAANEWLLFTDADCDPDPGLLAAYFSAPVDPDVGALAGAIDPGSAPPTVAARWAVARHNVDQGRTLELPFGPAAATGNVLVRRRSWADVGGFTEGILSGGDIEFCWRLGARGWRIDARPEARVSHPPQSSLRGLTAQVGRWAAGNAWQNRRHPGSSPPPRTGAAVGRALVGAPGFALRGQLERARLKLVDGAVAVSRGLGYRRGNASPAAGPIDGEGGIVIVVDTFPAVSETFVASEIAALRRAGAAVRVEAAARPERPLLGGARGLRVNYLEDEGRTQRLAALAWLAGRHPVRCARDLLTRRRWPAAERLPLRGLAPLVRRLAAAGDDHLHVHFASPAATHALRAGGLAGVPVSIAAHAYDIYARPTGLLGKLAAADFVAASCEYTRLDLQEMLDGDGAAKVHTVIMGVDADRFRRRTPYPGGRTVVAIGRYVEKKGFEHLIAAAGILVRGGEPIQMVIAGEGPLRGSFESLIGELGLESVVELPAVPDSQAVRELLERADLLAMPSVIAGDGDRDSMPVVVKEAMAMAVPVVASDAVGLPEIVSPEWGRLVAPGSPEGLATAIAELLSLPAERRAAMGDAGRAFVIERCNTNREAERLLALIGAARH